MSEKYEILIGFDGEAKKELHGVEETAEYICDRGRFCDLTITKPDGAFVLGTYGTFINQIVDFDYRAKLMPILTKKQMKQNQINIS